MPMLFGLLNQYKQVKLEYDHNINIFQNHTISFDKKFTFTFNIDNYGA